MKKLSVVSALLAIILAGCIIVPDRGYYRGGYGHHHHHHGYDHYDRYGR